MTFIINPGAGPVARATARNATVNMRAILRDVGLPGLSFRRPEDASERAGDEGRYCFFVEREGFPKVEVLMPGLRLVHVRYMNEEGQNIWHFPRLYVDGSSWVWMYAINCIRRRLLPEEEDV